LGGPESDRNNPRRIQAVQSVFDEMARRHAGQVTVLPISQWLCPNGHFQKMRDGVVLRPDGVHVGGDGPAVTWEHWLGPRILQIARTPKRAPLGSGSTPLATATGADSPPTVPPGAPASSSPPTSSRSSPVTPPAAP
jgi:hypothetical protein